MKLRFAVPAVLAFATTSGATFAGGIETPGLGVQGLGRGGAWLARADDALAAHFNPAAMVRNPDGAHLGAHLMLRKHCFERMGEDGAPVSPGQGLNAAPGEVCADIPPFPNPQVGATYHLARRFAIGLAVVGPHKHGVAKWPTVVQYENAFGVKDADHPAPQRYLMLDDDALAVFPTLSASYAILPNLSVGAGFIWGLASFEFSNMAVAVSTPEDAAQHDIKSTISGFDGFMPGFVASAAWAPTRRLELAGWYRFVDAIKSDVDLFAEANYFNQGRVDEEAIADPANQTRLEDAGTFRFVLPMEARLALRYRHPRSSRGQQAFVTKHGGYARDPMSEDLFDLELDLGWANNSAVKSVEIFMSEGIQINGTPGFVPPDAGIVRNWRDVVDVRLGGEFVAIPDLLAVRAGGFFESKGVEDRYLSLDFHQGTKFGFGAGATVRLATFDVSASYGHTFFGALDNGGQGAVHGLSGDETTGFRTTQVINGGRATASLDEVALGATVHY